MWLRGFSLSTFAFLSLLLIELESMWYFCNLPPVFTEDLSDVKIFVAIVFFSKRCDNDVSLTHATIAIIVIIWIFQVLCTVFLSLAERDKVRQRGSGAESRARALRADQGLYTRN